MNRAKSFLYILVPAVLILLILPIQAQQEMSFKIIINQNNPTDSLTKSQISKLFLKKVTQWDSGYKVFPVDLTENNDARRDFSMKIHGKAVSAIKSYWQQQIFSGRSVPPPEKISDREIIEYISANANAIGYVSKDADINNVKVLNVMD